MKMVEQMEKLQQQNLGTIILVKNGIFFVAIGKDAIMLHKMLELKLTCMKQELCKVGFLVKNVEEYIKKLEEIGYSFKLFVKDNNDLEEIYNFNGKDTDENAKCLECSKCGNRKESEEDIIERVKKMRKYKSDKV